MSYRLTDFPYLAGYHPEELKSTILRTLRDYKGHVTQTMEHFGLSRFVFYRYIRRLGLQDQIAAIRDEFAAERRAGRKIRYSDARAKGVSTDNTLVERAKTHPDEVRQTVLWAFQDNQGNYNETLRTLAVSKPTLSRLLRELGIEAAVHEVQERFRLGRLDAGRREHDGRRLRKDRHSLYKAVASSGPA